MRQQHGRDESYHACAPADIVAFPHSTEHVAAVARICTQHRAPMIPFGTGTGLEGGVTAVQGGVCVALGRMDRVVEVNAEDFNVTVEPGVTREALNAYLRDTGLWFPVDPGVCAPPPPQLNAAGANASLCGMAATSASGTNAVRYGTMRENVMNLEAVLASGAAAPGMSCLMHNRRGAAHGRIAWPRAQVRGRVQSDQPVCGLGGHAWFHHRRHAEVCARSCLCAVSHCRVYGIPQCIAAAVASFPTVQDAVTATTQVMQAGISVARIGAKLLMARPR